jgi:hypothetical protein
MNALTNPASTNTILAIDLGKYKSVACIHEQATGEIRVTTLETSRAELRRLIGKEQPAVIIIEACLLAGWVHDLDRHWSVGGWQCRIGFGMKRGRSFYEAVSVKPQADFFLRACFQRRHGAALPRRAASLRARGFTTGCVHLPWYTHTAWRSGVRLCGDAT